MSVTSAHRGARACWETFPIRVNTVLHQALWAGLWARMLTSVSIETALARVTAPFAFAVSLRGLLALSGALAFAHLAIPLAFTSLAQAVGVHTQCFGCPAIPSAVSLTVLGARLFRNAIAREIAAVLACLGAIQFTTIAPLVWVFAGTALLPLKQSRPCPVITIAYVLHCLLGALAVGYIRHHICVSCRCALAGMTRQHWAMPLGHQGDGCNHQDYYQGDSKHVRPRACQETPLGHRLHRDGIFKLCEFGLDSIQTGVERPLWHC